MNLKFYKDRILELFDKDEVEYVEVAVKLNKEPTRASLICKMLAVKYPELFEYNRGVLKIKRGAEDENSS